LKAVLRAIVRRRLGDEVANRRKTGFTIPVERWLTGHWANELNTVESGSLLEQEGWLRPGTIRDARRRSNGTEVPVQLWTVLMLEHWLRRQSSSAVAGAKLSVT